MRRLLRKIRDLFRISCQSRRNRSTNRIHKKEKIQGKKKSRGPRAKTDIIIVNKSH